jgi:hypothetical protein
MPPPNPGSDDAVSRGCKCPAVDNARGGGIPTSDGIAFYYSDDCPVHGNGNFPGGRFPMKEGKVEMKEETTNDQP